MINIEVIQVIKEEDNSYTASLIFIDTDMNKTIEKRSVSALNLAEFKNKIRVYKTKIEEIQTEKLNLLAIVQQAIDEVMAE